VKEIGTVIKIRKNISIHNNEGIIGIVVSTNKTRQHEVYCTNGKTYWLLRGMFEVLSEI